MKLAYLAGPYRSPTNDGVFENIMHARKHARKWWMKGYAVICPHLNSMFMDGADTDVMFLEGDKEIIRRCDVVIMMHGWERSAGAKEELKLAQELKKEIIYDPLFLNDQENLPPAPPEEKTED